MTLCKDRAPRDAYTCSPPSCSTSQPPAAPAHPARPRGTDPPKRSFSAIQAKAKSFLSNSGPPGIVLQQPGSGAGGALRESEAPGQPVSDPTRGFSTDRGVLGQAGGAAGREGASATELGGGHLEPPQVRPRGGRARKELLPGSGPARQEDITNPATNQSAHRRPGSASVSSPARRRSPPWRRSHASQSPRWYTSCSRFPPASFLPCPTRGPGGPNSSPPMAPGWAWRLRRLAPALPPAARCSHVTSPRPRGGSTGPAPTACLKL